MGVGRKTSNEGLVARDEVKGSRAASRGQSLFGRQRRCDRGRGRRGGRAGRRGMVSMLRELDGGRHMAASQWCAST